MSKHIPCVFKLFHKSNPYTFAASQHKQIPFMFNQFLTNTGFEKVQQVKPACKRNFHTSSVLRASDPYKLLGVARDASKDEIKKKFKDLAKKYHPDICKEPNAKEKFAELNNAYQILIDDKKRQMYDATGSTEAAEQHDMHGGMGGMRGGHHADAQEIFNQFFGQGGPFGGPFSSAFREDPFEQQMRNQPMQGETVRKPLTVTLREAVFGTKKELRLNKATECNTCTGTGRQPNSKPRKCPNCGGSGRISMRQAFFMIEQPCNVCHGSGKMYDPCKPCGGQGYTREMKTFEVKIPEGTDNGTMLKLRGLGEPGINGGPPGDMILDIVVEKEPQFRRKGPNLETDAEIPFTTAILGGDIAVTSLAGDQLTAKIPAGLQPGDTVSLRGKGVKTRDGTGDLIVNIKMKIPKNISPEQRELMEKYVALDNDAHYKSSDSGFWKFFKKS